MSGTTPRRSGPGGGALTGVISLDYVNLKDTNADPLTKGLNRELVEKSLRGMRLKPIKE